MSLLAVAMAEEMGLDPARIEFLRIAGSIHDIGKIAVPSEILSKPGKLSESEFNLIRIHSQAGFDILSGVDFPWPIAEVILQHHERLDGSGYPAGLRGEEIMIEARILAVADVVESMSSHRPYRPSYGVEEALEEIEQNRGILYDITVVDACLSVFRQKGFSYEE
jgi:HD-GYP domain-containing protein (c-di-GMP phosphodiesterase class II)